MRPYSGPTQSFPVKNLKFYYSFDEMRSFLSCTHYTVLPTGVDIGFEKKECIKSLGTNEKTTLTQFKLKKKLTLISSSKHVVKLYSVS